MKYLSLLIPFAVVWVGAWICFGWLDIISQAPFEVWWNVPAMMTYIVAVVGSFVATIAKVFEP